MIKIENDFLSVTVSEDGAELKSINNKQNSHEYLWQGNAEWWPRNAPILFPVVGKLKNNTYSFQGKNYTLGQHGFARDKKFILESSNNTTAAFVLKSNEETLKVYPFEFELKVTYKLIENVLKISYEVYNPSSEEIYFSIGAHPAFNCPLFENEKFEDYYLEFEHPETLDRHLLTEGVFNGDTESVLNNQKQLQLNHELFIKDAIVFKNMKSSYMILKSNKSGYNLKFSFKDFRYFGIWQKPGAPFICLEPWCGIADNSSSTGNLREKEGIEKLIPNATFGRTYSIEV
jgi:galactose mutarotase-like enzyme